MLCCLIFHRRRMEILREKSSSFILVIDACSSQPCLNGGICNATANGFTCSCSPLLTGVRCEIGIGKFCDKSNFKRHFILIVRSSFWLHWFCATRLNDLYMMLAPLISTMLTNFNQIKFSLVRFYHASDPLTPESDLHLKSSYNFTPNSNIMVNGIKEMTTNLRCSWLLNIFSLSVL